MRLPCFIVPTLFSLAWSSASAFTATACPHSFPPLALAGLAASSADGVDDHSTAASTPTAARPPPQQDIDKVAQHTNRVLETTSPNPNTYFVNKSNDQPQRKEQESNNAGDNDEPPVVKDRIFDPTQFWTTHSGQF